MPIPDLMNILLVEDEALLARAEIRVLKKLGYQVISVFTGEQAIEAVRSNPDIDLVLMDIDLGNGMDGTAAAQAILDERDVPVVFLSSHIESEIVERTESVTSYGYVVKNSGDTIINASIKMAFKLHEAHRQLKKQKHAVESANQMLEEGEARYLSLLASLPGLIVVIQEGRIAYCNPTGAVMLGYASPEEIIGNLAMKCLPQLKSEKYQQRLKNAEEGQSNPPVVLQTTTRDGCVLWSESVSIPIQYGHKPAVLIMGIDITARKQAEDALRKSHEQFTLAVNGSQDGIWDWDLRNNVLFFSSRWKQMIGYEDAELPNIFPTFEERLHPDDRGRLLDYLDCYLKGEIGNYDIVFRFQHKDGSWRWIRSRGEALRDENGFLYRMAGSHTDITELIQVEQDLKQSEERYRTILDEMTDTVSVIDGDGTILFANPRAAQNMSGSTTENVIQRHIGDFVSPQQAPKLIENFRRTIDSGQPSEQEVLTTMQGRERWFYNRLKPISFGAEHTPAVLSMSLDISELKKAQEELVLTKQRLEYILGITRTGIDIIDSKYNLRYVDPEWQKMYGDPAGRKCYEYFLGTNSVCDNCGIAASLASKEKIIYENSITREGRRIVEVHVIPFQTREGEWLVAEFNRDITQQKISERAIRESETKLRSYVDYAPDAIMIVNSEGFYVDANPAACDLLGYTREEILKLHISNIVHPEDLEKGLDHFHQVVSTGRMDGDIRVIRKDGEERIIANSAVKLSDSLFLGFHKDITDRKRAEEALRKSEERYRMLLSSIQDSVYVLDREWRHTIVNQAAERYTGVPQETLLNSKLTDIFPGVEKTEFFTAFKRVMEKRLTDVVLAEYAFPDGRKGWYEVHVFPVEEGILCISHDVTNRKQMEAALRESEERWQFALEGAGDGVWDWNAQTNQVIYSRQWKAIQGYAEDELSDTLDEWDQRIHPDDRQSVYAFLDQHLSGETPFYQSEHRLCCKDATYKWILDRGKVVARMEDGKPLRIIGTHTDITARKQAEAALQDALKEKVALLSELQHRIKNSLVMIIALIDLEVDHSENPAVQSALETINTRVRTLANLYSLLYSSGSTQNVRLDEYLDNISQHLCLSHVGSNDNISLDVHLQPLEVDTKQASCLGLILNELLTNALKYAFPDDRHGRIQVLLRNWNGGVELRVSDDGVGLPAGLDPQDSPGLGLQLVGMLVEQLEGTLIFNGNEGHASRLEVDTDRLAARLSGVTIQIQVPGL